MSLPKPAERRQRTRSKDVDIVALDSAPLPIPPAPAGLLKATVTAWQRLWSSPLARTINVDSDLPAIERLLVLRDERARAFRGAKRARIFNFDGDTARHFLRDLCVYAMDVAHETLSLCDAVARSPINDSVESGGAPRRGSDNGAPPTRCPSGGAEPG